MDTESGAANLSNRMRRFLGTAAVLCAGLACVFAWRAYFTEHVNLIPDECSYWAWSRRLDWSYFDNSGLVAYLIRMSTELFGKNTPYSVRFPFLVLSGLTTYFLYKASFVLFGNRFRALLAAVLFNITPISLLGGSAAIHDNALVFFWTLGVWASAGFLKSGDPRWFYVMGIAAGLAIQSKYTGVLMLGCLFVFLIWTKRELLLRKEPWLGALIAAVFVVPIVWWNMRHDWASVYHIFFIGSGATSTGKKIADGLGYHAAQFLLVSPLFYLALIAASASSVRRNIFKPATEEALLLSFGLPLGLFGIMAFKGHVEANWAVMGYISTGILAVEVIGRANTENGPGFRRLFQGGFLKWATVLAVVPVLLVIAHAWIGLIPASLEKKLGKDDRIIWETRGWRGLGSHIAAIKSPEDVLAADTYQLCALLEFNVPGNPQVRYLAPWRRPTQFDVWEPSFDNMKGRNILFVSGTPLNPSSAALTTIYENFARVEPLPDYQIMYHGVPIRSVHVYRCYTFDPFSPRRLGPRSLFYRE
ncbi:MAG TPA: glycosyltransferase family 39 protein [Desulfomonilaceae bacterium]|nr:glycosyltransferase family 39 protein [Desulfomonilaceae bacterium]